MCCSNCGLRWTKCGARFAICAPARGEREVDAIVEVGGEVVAFEVKHTSRPDGSYAATLAWLRDQLADRFRAGFVVHTGGDTYPLGDRLWAIPVHTLPG